MPSLKTPAGVAGDAVSSVIPDPSSLVEATMTSLQTRFSDYNHKPSADMMAALEDVAKTLAAMAVGDVEKKCYLSSLDPGVGKTQTLVQFIKALLSSPDQWNHVGVILCVSRLEEIAKLCDALSTVSDKLAVFTSDQEYNRKGIESVDDAQVLITTQQMLESRLAGGSFSKAGQFYYRGKPRQVRVWDESFMPAHPLTISRDGLMEICTKIRTDYPELGETLEQIFFDLKGIEDRGLFNMPDFVAAYGVELNEVLGLLEEYGDNYQRVASELWYLSGQCVSVRQDGGYGNTVVHYRDTLPKDLAPLVILDASGNCRATYQDLQNSRKILQPLKSGNKRYDPLTINLWKTGGGKTVFRDPKKRRPLIDGIANTILTKPSKQWLVVHHKRDARMKDLEQEIRKFIGRKMDQSLMSFVSWGSHRAVNDYVNISNVILAGTLFLRNGHVEGLKRAAAGRPADKGLVTRSEQREMEIGESLHHILQALCRGSVRRCVGDRCAPMDAYIIASVRSGIPAALPELFPYCMIRDWKPVKRKLQGRIKQTVDILRRRMVDNGDTFASFPSVYRALGMAAGDFRTDVRCSRVFIDAIAEYGIDIQKGNRCRTRKPGFHRVTPRQR